MQHRETESGSDSSVPHAEQLLQALRYIAGELDEEETSAFEERLDLDQGLREAVADAVEIAAITSLIGPTATSTRPTPPRRILRRLLTWGSLAAAVALLTLVGLRGIDLDRMPEYQPDRSAEFMQPSKAETLASTWSDLREESEPGLMNDWLASFDEPEEPADLGISEVAPPSWMLEVAGLTPDSATETPQLEEN